MAISLASTENVPLQDLNTTPLIDVLLVLLVMLILSVPVASQSLQVQLPSPAPLPPEATVAPENRLAVTANGASTWNGIPVTDNQLITLLKLAETAKPTPLIRFEPVGAAPYDRTLHVLNLVKAADPALFAISGLDRFEAFGKQHGR